MYRSRKVVRLYEPQVTLRKLSKREEECPFCKLADETLVTSTANIRLVKNKFAYQFWDFMKVTDHLLLVPVRHVESLGQLNAKEKQEIMDSISQYEEQGYNVYARSTMSTIKSVPHQHTHLIKTDNIRAKFLFYLAKPYLLFRR